VIAHELAHLITLRGYLGRWVKVKVESGRVRIGTIADYEKLSKPQLTSVYLNGIYFGAIVIIATSIYTPMNIILLVPYVIGCKKDIQNVFRNK
jgi:MFS-type transporter involved in bile tolerance (Atg22 family)